MLVPSFGCSYETADIEFEYTLSQALDKGHITAGQRAGTGKRSGTGINRSIDI